MRALLERAYHAISLGLGRLLRASRYSSARVVLEGGETQVRKRRALYAPLLIWLSDPLMRVLNTGVCVLPQRTWFERERSLYEALYGRAVIAKGDGTLVLPFLPGRTLAALLEDPTVDESDRMRAMGLAVAALVKFHARGFTHGDAMAENVMVDLDAGVARWFDFETVHDARRPIEWRRGDDLRALLATCAIRTVPSRLAEAVQVILAGYGDVGMRRAVADNFASLWLRSLALHLGQAPLAFVEYRALQRVVGSEAAAE